MMADSKQENQIKWVGRGLLMKYHARSAVWWYYIRFCLPDGRRKTEKAGTTRAQADENLNASDGTDYREALGEEDLAAFAIQLCSAGEPNRG